jgi:hypothetical protein
MVKDLNGSVDLRIAILADLLVMNTNFHILSFVFFLVIFLSTQTTAQSKTVHLTFKYEEKIRKEKFDVTFYEDGVAFTTKRTKGGFLVPNEILKFEKLSVGLVSKKYKLFFAPIFMRDLDSDWTIGIDNKPFHLDNINVESSYDNVTTLQYLSFRPKGDGFGTRLVVKIGP